MTVVARGWLARPAPWRRRASVLLYHRVAAPALDPWSLAVAPCHFDEHMAVLRRHAAVVALDELPALLSARRAPRHCVAVTFDDGYADNLHAALPMLERHEVPATVFVATGALDGSGFWWDRLASLLLGPGDLPARLEVRLGTARHEYAVDDWAAWRAGSYASHVAWQADTPPPTPRHALFLALWRALQAAAPADRDRALEDLERCVAIETANADDRPLASERSPSADRSLATAELGRLAAHPLIEIGAHTVSHPRLSSLAPAEQRTEVAASVRVLEALVGRPVRSFAYPYGRPGDYTADTVQAVRDAGLVRACVNSSGTVVARSDPFRLPRAYVADVDGDVFERRLARWLDAPAR